MDRFTPDQIREYNDAFCLLDSTDRGYIPSIMLRDSLKLIGYNPTDVDLENITIMIDSDGNGQIDFGEFMELISSLETEEGHTRDAKIAFNAFDFMGNGYIPANDIKEALKHVMEKADPQDVEDVLRHFKLNKNRKVGFEEFKDMTTLPNYKKNDK